MVISSAALIMLTVLVLKIILLIVMLIFATFVNPIEQSFEYIRILAKS